MGLAAVQARTFEGSPALRALLAELSKRPVFEIREWPFTGRFSDGQERIVHGHRIHREGDEANDDRWLADLDDGNVWIFTPSNARPICATEATAAMALSALRGAVPLAWTFVL